MSKREILAGVADQTIDVFIQDSSSTTGGGLTGLVYNSSSLTCYYRKGATGTPTALSLATQTVGGAHSDGGFVAVDGTNCPGQYRLDLSDTIVATAGMVTLYLKGATNMAPCLVEIEVVAVDKFNAVRMGMTALPNAAADAAGGLPISDAGGLDLDAKLANTNEVTAARMGALTDWINGGRLDLILDIIAADVVNIDGAAMRGTDGAYTGTPPTVSQIWTTALTEAYRSAGATGTATQLLYEILQNITEFAISGTTKTVKKLDGSTTAKTYTLDSSTAPTLITETT